MHEISTVIDIDAPAAVVWDVLTDTARYAEWNPFVPELTGTLRAGERLRVRIAPPGGRGMTFRPVVTAAEPGRRLSWLGTAGVRGLFDGAHRFVLTDLPGGRTRLEHAERFTGLLVPLMRGSLAATEEGFTRMNEALRARAEARAASRAR